jgi:hypothetical protein
MKKYVVLKLIGLAILTMITLVIISVLEVTVYSYVINPGKEASVYDAHAMESAPYISGIFGFIIFFLLARYWKKKGYANAFKLSNLFPLVYLLMDIVIVLAAQVDWATYALIFIIANGAKFLGSYLGYKLSKQGHVVTCHEA